MGREKDWLAMIDKFLTGFMEQWKKAPLAGWLVIVLFIQSNGLEILEIGVEQKAEQSEADEVKELHDNIILLKSQVNLLVALHQANYEASTDMRFKPGVAIQGIRPELLAGLTVANDVYRKYEEEMTVTSVVDGKHSSTSLHYSGCAADLRIRDLPDNIAPLITKEIQESLGNDFDVLLEKDHIHIEYQPRLRVAAR